VARCAQMGNYLGQKLEGLRSHPIIGDVRGEGLMRGVEFVKDKQTKEPFPSQDKIGAKVCAAMRPKGTMMRPLGDCLVLMPAVAMDIETLKKLLDIIEDTLKNDLPKMIKCN